jgi:hypothetical protein
MSKKYQMGYISLSLKNKLQKSPQSPSRYDLLTLKTGGRNSHTWASSSYTQYTQKNVIFLNTGPIKTFFVLQNFNI